MCDTGRPEGRPQLHTHVPREWGLYTAWEAHSCQYAKYSADAAKECLAARNTKVMIVGDRCLPLLIKRGALS